MYLWRAVDSEGEVLDLLVQPKRDTKAALRLMRKLLKKQGYAPDELVTDKLGSYGAARRELRLSCRHEQGLRRNNRAENSISWYDGASASSNASSRRDQPSAFSPCMLRLTTRSTFNVISSPAAPFGPSGPRRPSMAEGDRCNPAERAVRTFVISLRFP
jgi:transposase-like protein